MKLKHIYWFAHYNLTCPSARYRGKYALESLHKKNNISYDFVYPSMDFLNILHFFKIYFSVLFLRKRNSLLVFQKIRTNRFYSKALKLLLVFRKENTLYDIDDAEYLRCSDIPIRYFIKHCSAVSVASLVLEKYCFELNKNIICLTSPVITHEFKKTNRNKKPVIGWVGDYGNGNSIEKDYSHKTSLNTLIFPALTQLEFDFKLVLIGIKEREDIPEIKKYFSAFRNIELEIPENLNWENDSWLYEKIKEFDIGISPMLDFEFNRAKSAFKSKQYLSCGIPCIASNIGENSNFINETNGALCNTLDEFKEALEGICKLSDSDYMKMSFASMNSKPSFSMDNYCDSLISIYKK